MLYNKYSGPLGPTLYILDNISAGPANICKANISKGLQTYAPHMFYMRL